MLPPVGQAIIRRVILSESFDGTWLERGLGAGPSSFTIVTHREGDWNIHVGDGEPVPAFRGVRVFREVIEGLLWNVVSVVKGG